MDKTTTPFTYVKTNDDNIDRQLHFTQLFRYVSAYELCDSRVEDLKADLLVGLQRAKIRNMGMIVDQDGEHFFVCNPNGSFDLCIRWKSYRIAEPEKENG